MVRDLLRSGVLIGETKPRVTVLLGKPTGELPGILFYDLGVSQELRSNPMALSDILNVKLDEHSKVSQVCVAD